MEIKKETVEAVLKVFKNNLKSLNNTSVNKRLSPTERLNIPKIRNMYETIIKDIESQL